MQTAIELPKAFSVRDDHEFYPIGHLMARLNPQLRILQVATGMHVSGSGTVFWGIVYREGQALSKKDVEAALREGGFDFAHNVLTQVGTVWSGHPAHKTPGPEPSAFPASATRR
jgi:hypothetical protein